MDRIVDELIGLCVSAAIVGNNGLVWFATPGFYPKTDEFKNFAKAFDQQSNCVYDGLLFQNQIYTVTSHNSTTIQAVSLNGYMVLKKCQECFVFAYDEDKISYESCKDAVFALAERIVTNNLDKE